jgi:hypothetical protein
MDKKNLLDGNWTFWIDWTLWRLSVSINFLKQNYRAHESKTRGDVPDLFIAAFYKPCRKITGDHLVNFLIFKNRWAIRKFSYFSNRKSSTITIANAIPFSHFAKESRLKPFF